MAKTREDIEAMDRDLDIISSIVAMIRPELPFVTDPHLREFLTTSSEGLVEIAEDLVEEADMAEAALDAEKETI
jgi:hypothetical protein